MSDPNWLKPFLNTEMANQREALVRLFTPALFHTPGKLLYVGASPERVACIKALASAGNEITVLEIWPAYVEALQTDAWCMERIAHVVHGDVQQVDQVSLPHSAYDYTVWWHGPEHIARETVEPTLAKLEQLTRHVIVIATPWGWHTWPAEDGNPYQSHASALYPQGFGRLGYRYAAIWPEGEPGGHLMAWKVT
jgi:hypothetical protein